MRPPAAEQTLMGRIRAYESRGNKAKADEARSELSALKWERHIRALIDNAPPLTDEQRTTLAALLQNKENA